MKRIRLSSIAQVTFILTLIWSLWLLGDWPAVFVRETALDINSGDFRKRVYVCRVPVRSRVVESSLSREIRRLGLTVPSNHIWEPAFVQRYEPGHFDYVYGSLSASVFGQLLGLLNETNTPDEERRLILDRFMKSMRTQNAHRAERQGYVLMVRIAEKYGLQVFEPRFVEQLKESEAWRDGDFEAD